MPTRAQKGEIIEIKTLIQHNMETGHRRDKEGQPITRDLINQFVVTYANTEILRAEFNAGVSANPFVAFFLTASDSGEVIFEWTGDSNFSVRETRMLMVA
jgi:sulfur-oxidizing protein SoxZ